jgi:hypothetical protein
VRDPSGSAGRGAAARRWTKKFTEPVALLSTSPVNLRLPPTALGSCFDLLALRARCKRELRARPPQLQGRAKREGCNLRKLLRAQHKIGVRAACSKGAGPKKFTEPVALSSTSPGNFRLPPTAPASCFDLLALRARCKNNLTRRPGPDKTRPLRKARILRTANCPHFHGLCGRLGRSLWKVRGGRRRAGSSFASFP